MKKKFNFFKYLGFGILFGVLFLVIGSYYSRLINQELQDEAQIFLTEVANQSVSIVEGKIKAQAERLNFLAQLIEFSKLETQDDMLALVRDQAKTLSFEDMGVALADGQLKALDGSITDINDYPIYKEVMNGETVISDKIIWRQKKQRNNVYASPIKKGGQVIGALYGTVNTSELATFLDQETFQDKGYSHIVKSNGVFVFYSDHQNSPQEATNLFEFWQDKELQEGDKFKEIQAKMVAGLSGYTRGNYAGLDRYIYYTPLTINDWFLISVVPVTAVNQQADIISRYSRLMINIGFTVISLLFLGILILQDRSKKKLENIAYIDEVTGGHNWQKFKLNASNIFKNNQFGKYVMIFFDIDRFRFINEEYGHETGDALLKLVMAILEETNRPGETYGRVSNDHFVVLCQAADDDKFSQRIERFTKDLNEKKEAIQIRGKIICQFGICDIMDSEKDNLEKVREKANMARIEAKRRDNMVWFFYSNDFQEKIGKEKEIIDSMENAIKWREFEMYLQPKYDLNTKAYCGCEALVRWNRLAGSFLYPSDFIPVFEKNGFIAKLDAYMMEEAFKTIKKWEEAGHQEISMSVNVSRKNLNYCSFIPNLLAMAEKYKIDTKLIEIELTESSIFEDIDRMIEVGTTLRKHGFKMSMDDFGSGYSSVNILAKLPLDTIKMDRGFFNDNFREKKGYVVVESVIKLIKKLGLTVVAEGIEMEDEIILLKDLKCDIVQGYYYGKPMPVPDFEKLVFGQKIKNGNVKRGN